MGADVRRLSQAKVDKWLRENRPDFKPADYWFYTNTNTPIPGTCLVCGAKCAPRLSDMKNSGWGHCRTCGDRAAGEANRARGEAEMRREAAKRGYEVVRFFTKRYKHSGHASGFQDKTYATLRCSCDNEWDVSQSHLCSAGNGCGNCSESGFDTGKPADLYLLTRNKRGLQETQYGISNVLDQRLAKHESSGWRLVDVISGPGDEILALENLIKDAMKSEGIYRREYHDEKYDGYTEAWDARDGLRPFMSLERLIGWADRALARREVAA